MGKYRYRLVCSNRPRPQLQSSHAKWGGGGWNRETHHIALDDGKPLYVNQTHTICGRNASDWLVIDGKSNLTAAAIAEAEDGDLCQRCAVQIARAAERQNAA